MSGHRSALATDFYQLTMAQGYLRSGMNTRIACFDLFFRRHPFNGGYTVAAGLEAAARFIENFAFNDGDISFLKDNGMFGEDFLDYLRGLKFTGDVHAVDEGSLVFPLEPVLRVTAPLDQCQILESPLLNIINFQSLIATKAARVCQEAGYENVLEFGLRRAQGFDGAMTASRAAYIGGCAATSNVEAGRAYGIPVRGTHAHSWVMAFDSELDSFRKFAQIYPDNSILLADTYDTLNSGVPNAIKVGLEMKERGENLNGIRLDSGDLAFLSIEARKMLDEAGLTETKIVCSSELDETIIHDLKSQGAKIDIYGVGTKLVTADGDPSLSGVYKLAASKGDNGVWRMTMKRSDEVGKSTLPGMKQIWRMYDKNDEMMADLIELEESPPDFSQSVTGVSPFTERKQKLYDGIVTTEGLLKPVIRKGAVVYDFPPLSTIRENAKAQLDKLHPTMRRILNPHVYKVSLGPALAKETRRLIDKQGD